MNEQQVPRPDDERLKRLRLMATSSIVGADIKWLVDEYDRLTQVFEEACNEVRLSHVIPCDCKYCHVPPAKRVRGYLGSTPDGGIDDGP